MQHPTQVPLLWHLPTKSTAVNKSGSRHSCTEVLAKSQQLGPVTLCSGPDKVQTFRTPHHLYAEPC